MASPSRAPAGFSTLTCPSHSIRPANSSGSGCHCHNPPRDLRLWTKARATGQSMGWRSAENSSLIHYGFPYFTPYGTLSSGSCYSIGTTFVALQAAPPGPEPQIPEGGVAPGNFPNTSVSAVNVTTKGSSVFNSSVEVTGLQGQGPIPWSVNRYNRGDFALRLAPGDPEDALGNLGQGSLSSAILLLQCPQARLGAPARPREWCCPLHGRMGQWTWVMGKALATLP